MEHMRSDNVVVRLMMILNESYRFYRRIDERYALMKLLVFISVLWWERKEKKCDLILKEIGVSDSGGDIGNTMCHTSGNVCRDWVFPILPALGGDKIPC